MSASGQNVDNLDAFLDFSEYDNISAYQSPSLSPSTTSKNGFSATQRSVSQATSPTMPTTSQPLTGPSHQYELYKQQTGLVPGALASTLAVSNNQVTGYNPVGLDYLGLSPNNDLFDFNTAPSQGSLNEMDMDFDSPNDSLLYESTVSPNALTGQTSPSMTSPSVVPTQTSNVGRLWPGMHSQAAAVAKAQAQQQRQQQIIQQQRQNAAQSRPKSKSNQPTDPIVEQKITQLLNSMRAKPAQGDAQSQAPLLNISRPKKDEDDMDEDERLLASEEGKKLSSKERRQLRNKVSARAFRSRRKEYITQLETEIANKVTENGDLRAHNKALLEENKRLSDLTRMLLSSPSFSNFLDNLGSSASQLPPQTKTEQPQQERRQLPKDVNPAAYAAATHVQQQQHQRIGMAMIPEQSMDMSMLSLEGDNSFNFQPQVFALLETPEMPASLDASLLSGKESNFVGEQYDSDEEKLEIPSIERPAEEEKAVAPKAPEEPPLDPEFEADPAFALFHSTPASERSRSPAELDMDSLSQVDIFGGIEPAKVLARYDLHDASEAEQAALLSMAKFERLSDRLAPLTERLDRLTLDF